MCFDKLDLIKGMIKENVLTDNNLCDIFGILNDASHQIDEYIDRTGTRDNLYNGPVQTEQETEDYLNKCRRSRTNRFITKNLK